MDRPSAPDRYLPLRDGDDALLVSWCELLSLLLRDDADILWLEDADQNLQGKPPVRLDHFVAYRCRVNYRSPESIARFIRNRLPFAFEPGNDLPGLGVGVQAYDDPASQPKIVARVLLELIRRGSSHDDIVRGKSESSQSRACAVSAHGHPVPRRTCDMRHEIPQTSGNIDCKALGP